MKKFRFRLQRVLDYRHSLKKESENELAMRNMELVEAKKREQEIMAAQDDTAFPENEIVSIEELEGRDDYLVALQEALIHQRLAIIEATAAVERAREAYIQKAIEEKTLQKLKDRRREEHKEEVGRYEKKELDNITIQRYRFTRKDTGQGA